MTPIFVFLKNSPFYGITIKREDLSETGSHKFRYVKNQLEKLKEKGIRTVVCSTTGNVGITASYYAKKFGITVYALMPEQGDLSRAKKIEEQGGILIFTPRPKRFAQYISKKYQIPLLRGSRDRIARQGYENLGQEIKKQIPKARAIVNFSSSGVSSLGLFTAYKKNVPSLHVVHEKGGKIVLEEELMSLVKKTHGKIWTVSEAEKKQAEKEVKDYGLETSWEGISAFAVAKKMKDQYDSIVVIFSGKKWFLKKPEKYFTAKTFNDIDRIMLQKKSQLIYVTLDLRRGLFVSEATGALILCSYTSDLLSKMRKQGAKIWCFQEACPTEKKNPTSTAELLGNGKTLKMLRDLKADLSFLVFKPSNKVKTFVEKQGWKLLSPDIELCRKLEDKILFFELAKKYGLRIPKGEIVLFDQQKIPEYEKKYGNPFIVQARMGHAGSSTWIIKDRILKGPSEKGGIINGQRVKLSEFIQGNTYTLNAYISSKGKLAFSPLFQQLMNVPEWNEFVMGTIGISPEENFLSSCLKDLRNTLKKLGVMLRGKHFFGFFGVDLIWNGKTWYLIEVNPRFTASISLQSKIDLLNKRVPLLKLHAEEQELKTDRFDFLEKSEYSFGHMILRNSFKKIWKIPKTLKSGIYKGQDPSNPWSIRSRSLEAKDLQDNEILFILAHQPGTAIKPGSDFATLIFRGSALKNGKIDDRFFDFYERNILGHLIRSQDFLKDRYAKILEKNPVFIFQKPKKNPQTQILPKETIQILGKYKNFMLVSRADGTKGFLNKEVKHTLSSQRSFELPGKKSLDAEHFFQQWKGTPYLRGGNSKNGIDCSAFTQRYFWEVKGILIPKHSEDQKAQLQNDELIFFHSKEKNIPHGGIQQNGKIWHACLEKGVVEEDREEVLKKYKID